MSFSSDLSSAEDLRSRSTPERYRGPNGRLQRRQDRVHRRLTVLSGAVLCLAAPLAGQGTNLLTNPGFDESAAGWTLFSSPLKETSWSDFDQAGPGRSGSVYATTVHPDARFSVTSARQCVPVQEGMIYDFGSFFYQPGGQTTAGRAEVVVSWRREVDCVGPLSESVVSSSSVEDAWTGTFGQAVAPSNARSAAVDLKVHKVEAGGFHEVFFDNVYFALAGTMVELCEVEPHQLCIGDRFRASVEFQVDELTGLGSPVPLDRVGLSSGGMFWFFSPDNPEILLKVLDGCALNGHFWIFYSAGTDVAFELEVTDRTTDLSWTSNNPGGTLAPPVRDLTAFPCQQDD